MSRPTDTTQRVDLDNEAADARGFLEQQRVARQLEEDRLRTPRGWLKARTWRERQRLRAWLQRKLIGRPSTPPR